MATYNVTVTGLEFYGHHGVSEAERQVGHWFAMDLDLLVDGNGPDTDELADTVDYGAAAQVAYEIGTTTSYRLVERLAQHMGEALLARFELVQAIEITLDKLAPPVSVPVRSTGVRLRVVRAVE